MKDEIKEILDRWNKVCNKELLSTDMTLDEMIMFRDYIINLQEENEKIHKDFAELSERYFFTKSRNGKAIEYIKSFGSDSDRKNYSLYYNEIINKVLNILNGGDE